MADSGFEHIVVPSKELKLAHLIAALLKRWPLGTNQGAVRPSHFLCYLDEFTFRFNRHTSASRGKLFYRLVQQAMMVCPAPAPTINVPAVPFLVGADNFNLDPIDEDSDHKIYQLLESSTYPQKLISFLPKRKESSCDRIGSEAFPCLM